MGSMHPGLEDRFWHYPELPIYLTGRLLPRTREGRRRLIVTGGISPNRQGWLLPFGGKLNSVFDLPPAHAFIVRFCGSPPASSPQSHTLPVANRPELGVS
jgi:hypothetical protein